MHRARLYQHYPGRETSGSGSAPLIDAEVTNGNVAAQVVLYWGWTRESASRALDRAQSLTASRHEHISPQRFGDGGVPLLTPPVDTSATQRHAAHLASPTANHPYRHQHV